MFPPLLGPASPDPALTLADIDKPTSLLLAPDQSELTGTGRTLPTSRPRSAPSPALTAAFYRYLGGCFYGNPPVSFPPFPKGIFLLTP